MKVSSGYGSGTVTFAVNCPGSRLWKARGSVWLIRSTVLGVAMALASGKRFLICERTMDRLLPDGRIRRTLSGAIAGLPAPVAKLEGFGECSTS